jgi:hypothetical protein
VGKGTRFALTAIVALVYLLPAPGAIAAERFEVVALSGTQSSDVTQNLANEEAGTTCMRAATENVSFALARPVVVHVSKRRVRGPRRTVWSLATDPASPFEVVPLVTDAAVSRRTSSRGPCPEADCSAEAVVPWTIQLSGARPGVGGARVGAQPFTSEGLESCAYDGARALAPIAPGAAFPHLFEARELLRGDAKRITSSATFAVGHPVPGGSTSSRVEIMSTLKRR